MQAAGADDPLLQLESLPLYVHFDFKTHFSANTTQINALKIMSRINYSKIVEN